MDVGFHRGSVNAQFAAGGQLQGFGLLGHPFVNLTSALGAKQSEGSPEAGVIGDRIFKKAGKATVEQTVPQFVFQLAKRPAFEVFEHDAAQQSIGSDSGPTKVFGTEAPPAQFFRAEAQELVVLEQQVDFIEGDVLDGGHLLGEGEEEQRRLPDGVTYHYLIDIID